MSGLFFICCVHKKICVGGGTLRLTAQPDTTSAKRTLWLLASVVTPPPPFIFSLGSYTQ
jgi:hypothetical protein